MTEIVNDAKTRISFLIPTNITMGNDVFAGQLSDETVHFLCRPELLASTLFVSGLKDNETLFVAGSRAFSVANYALSGAVSFEPNLNHDRSSVAILANPIKYNLLSKHEQFEVFNIGTEILKVCCAFNAEHEQEVWYSHTGSKIDQLPSIVTGNWGCDEENMGDPSLKFIIQVLAASICERSLIYCPQENENLLSHIKQFYNNGGAFVTVQECFKKLETFAAVRLVKSGTNLLEYLKPPSSVLMDLDDILDSHDEKPTTLPKIPFRNAAITGPVSAPMPNFSIPQPKKIPTDKQPPQIPTPAKHPTPHPPSQQPEVKLEPTSRYFTSAANNSNFKLVWKTKPTQKRRLKVKIDKPKLKKIPLKPTSATNKTKPPSRLNTNDAKTTLKKMPTKQPVKKKRCQKITLSDLV